MTPAQTNEWSGADPELRESVRVYQHQRSMRLIRVAVVLLLTLGTAALYAFLSYSGH